MKTTFIVTTMLSIIASSGLLYLGILHNPQYEFISETGHLELANTAKFMAINFVVVWGIINGPIILFLLAKSLLKRKLGRP